MSRCLLLGPMLTANNFYCVQCSPASHIAILSPKYFGFFETSTSSALPHFPRHDWFSFHRSVFSPRVDTALHSQFVPLFRQISGLGAIYLLTKAVHLNILSRTSHTLRFLSPHESNIAFFKNLHSSRFALSCYTISVTLPSAESVPVLGFPSISVFTTTRKISCLICPGRW